MRVSIRVTSQCTFTVINCPPRIWLLHSCWIRGWLYKCLQLRFCSVIMVWGWTSALYVSDAVCDIRVTSGPVFVLTVRTLLQLNDATVFVRPCRVCLFHVAVGQSMVSALHFMIRALWFRQSNIIDFCGFQPHSFVYFFANEIFVLPNFIFRPRSGLWGQ